MEFVIKERDDKEKTERGEERERGVREWKREDNKENGKWATTKYMKTCIFSIPRKTNEMLLYFSSLLVPFLSASLFCFYLFLLCYVVSSVPCFIFSLPFKALRSPCLTLASSLLFYGRIIWVSVCLSLCICLSTYFLSLFFLILSVNLFSPLISTSFTTHFLLSFFKNKGEMSTEMNESINQ